MVCNNKWRLLNGKHSCGGHLSFELFSLCPAEIEHLADLKNGGEIRGHLAIEHKQAVELQQL